MTNDINFTFIIPVHNGMPYIKECVESILNQDNQDFNIVILENASDDGTQEYLETIKNNSKIQIIPSDKLLSIEDNFKRILYTPTKEYMMFVGADDSYETNYLYEISKMIKKHPKCSIYRTNVNLINENSEIIFKPNPIKEKISVYDYLSGRLRHTYFETGAGYCIKSSEYKKIGGIDCIHRLMHTDDKLFMELILNSYMAVSSKYAANYRSHPKSESGTPNPKATLDGYNYFFNWIYNLGDKKLINIVKDFLPYHLTQIVRFFSKAEIIEHKNIYNLYDINETSLHYKLLNLKNKYFYVHNQYDKYILRFAFIKIKKRKNNGN